MEKVESFELDHTRVKAPYVRLCGVTQGPRGDRVSKFDLRFLQPNAEAFGTAALHALEHLLAHGIREHLDGVIDLSPMGCRTGFYLTVWGEVSPAQVKQALEKGTRSPGEALRRRAVRLAIAGLVLSGPRICEICIITKAFLWEIYGEWEWNFLKMLRVPKIFRISPHENRETLNAPKMSYLCTFFYSYFYFGSFGIPEVAACRW